MTLLRVIAPICCAVVLAVASFPVPAVACIGPSDLLEVEATAPADGEENVETNPTVVVQLGPLLGYPGEGFDTFSGVPLLTINDAETGAEVTTVDAEIGAPLVEDPYARGIVIAELSLDPNTMYVATLTQDAKRHEWSFTTGDGEVEPFTPAQSFQINLDAYFDAEAVWDCCPTEFVGECPRCFQVGEEPIPTINAGFELLPHPNGPAGFVYVLQSRRDVDATGWEDVTSGAFDADRGSLAQIDHRLVNRDVCMRVVARSVIGPELEYTSDEECRRGADHFSDPPDYELDYSRVMCGDETPDEETPDDDTSEDVPVPDDGGDVDTDEESDDEVDGWELDEDGAKSIDSGCGCSSTSRRSVPGSVLLLAALVVAMRRRRERD